VAALYALPLGIKQKIQRPIRLGQFVPELVEHLEAVVALVRRQRKLVQMRHEIWPPSTSH
jgi:hypothetical protein